MLRPNFANSPSKLAPHTGQVSEETGLAGVGGGGRGRRFPLVTYYTCFYSVAGQPMRAQAEARPRLQMTPAPPPGVVLIQTTWT